MPNDSDELERIAIRQERAGFVTSAARAGEPERRIMRTTAHKSIEMVLRYVRQAHAFADNSVLAVGL